MYNLLLIGEYEEGIAEGKRRDGRDCVGLREGLQEVKGIISKTKQNWVKNNLFIFT